MDKKRGQVAMRMSRSAPSITCTRIANSLRLDPCSLQSDLLRRAADASDSTQTALLSVGRARREWCGSWLPEPTSRRVMCPLQQHGAAAMTEFVNIRHRRGRLMNVEMSSSLQPVVTLRL